MRPLISIGVIAVCIGAYFVYIKPMTVDIKVHSLKKDEYNNVLNRVKEIKEKRDSILADYNSIPQSDIDRLNKIIPEKLNSVLLLNDLSVLGAKYGVTIKEFRVTDNSSNNDSIVSNSGSVYKTSNVGMRMTGEYLQVLNFLWDVESGLSLIDVVSLSVKPEANSARNAQLADFILEASIYSLR